MKIAVSIEGIAPLLQHRFPEEEHEATGSRKKKKVYDPEEDAIAALYKKEDGTIYQPARHFEAALIKAAVAFKFEGRKTYKDAFKGGIFINPAEIVHKYPEWEIDRQPVVIQRARIMRARPRFDKWALDFEIEIIDDRIAVDVVKEALEYTGLYVGIGDLRPRYGRFKVIKFEEDK